LLNVAIFQVLGAQAQKPRKTPGFNNYWLKFNRRKVVSQGFGDRV